MEHDDQEPFPPTPRHRLSEYDRQRLEEMNRANLAAFWLAFPFVVFGGLWLLIEVLDWWGSL